jgi:hypothetical protein
LAKLFDAECIDEVSMKKKKLLTNRAIDFDTSDLGYMGMNIPDHTQLTLVHYLVNGYNPGGFLSAMLAMDMNRALSTADTSNRRVMWAIGRWISTQCPARSWGSYEAVESWCSDQDGLRSAFAEEYKKSLVWLTLIKE